MNSEIVVKLLHQKQFIAENYLGGLVPVALDVRHKLLDGDVEFLDLCREIHTSGTKINRVKTGKSSLCTETHRISLG